MPEHFSSPCHIRVIRADSYMADDSPAAVCQLQRNHETQIEKPAGKGGLRKQSEGVM